MKKKFNLDVAMAKMDKLNVQKVDAKRKKIDNFIALIDGVADAKGTDGMIIFERKAVCEALGVTSGALRNYLSQIREIGYEITDEMINGAKAERVRKIQTVASQPKKTLPIQAKVQGETKKTAKLPQKPKARITPALTDAQAKQQAEDSEKIRKRVANDQA